MIDLTFSSLAFIISLGLLMSFLSWWSSKVGTLIWLTLVFDFWWSGNMNFSLAMSLPLTISPLITAWSFTTPFRALNAFWACTTFHRDIDQTPVHFTKSRKVFWEMKGKRISSRHKRRVLLAERDFPTNKIFFPTEVIDYLMTNMINSQKAKKKKKCDLRSFHLLCSTSLIINSRAPLIRWE